MAFASDYFLRQVPSWDNTIEFPYMVSLNLLNSVTKNIIFQKHYSNLPPSHLLCKRPTCYHSASKTLVAERIFKLSPIHVSVIYQIPWIHWISDPFRENSNVLVFLAGQIHQMLHNPSLILREILFKTVLHNIHILNLTAFIGGNNFLRSLWKFHQHSPAN